jgi:hypothetical protein
MIKKIIFGSALTTLGSAFETFLGSLTPADDI